MDKRITRLANSGAKSVVMFGKTWTLSPSTWGVRNPKRPGPPRMVFRPSPVAMIPDVEFVAGRPRLDFSNAKVYKIDDAEYLDPRNVGGLCIRREDAYATRLIHR